MLAFTRQTNPAGLTMGNGGEGQGLKKKPPHFFRKSPVSNPAPLASAMVSLSAGSISQTHPPEVGGPGRTGRGRTYLVDDMVQETKERQQRLAVAGKCAVCVGELIQDWCPVLQDSSSMVSPLPCDSAHQLPRVLWVKLTSCHGTALEEKSGSTVLYTRCA